MERRTELRADPAKTRAWQDRSRKPLERSAGLKCAALNSTKPRSTSKPRRRSPAKLAFERELDAITPALAARSGSRCEARIVGVCTRKAEHRHHRKRRSQGGKNTLANLLHVCQRCHSYLHGHARWARPVGLLVRQSQDPAAVPVVVGAVAA